MIFTIEEIQERLNCGKGKAIALLKNLADHQLIHRSRPKKDGPYHITIKPFQSAVPKSNLPKFQNQTCASSNIEPQQVRKSDLNKTDNNKTDRNNTDTIRPDWEYEIKKNIYYEYLCMEYPKDRIDSIVEVMVETVNSPAQSIWISGQPRSMESVRQRLLTADDMRIRYILDHMKRNSGSVQSYRSYYLARLWDSEGMVDAFYESWVRHDRADGLCKPIISHPSGFRLVLAVFL